MKTMITAAMALMLCIIYVPAAGAAEEAAAAPTPAPEAGGQALIYFVASGRTFFQVHGRVQGVSDSPLTEEAAAQAHMLGRGLKDIEFTAAFSSDLGRHRQTAQSILEENINPVPPLVELAGLRDWNYGGFEGSLAFQMWTPIFKRHNLEYDGSRTRYDLLLDAIGYQGVAQAISEADPLKAAETYAAITARSAQAMDRVIADTLAAGGGNVLVVSSGNEIPTILTMLAPEQFNGENIGACSVTILKYKEGRYRLEIVGDESYLNRGK